jgi:predicted transcriptional regulator
MSLSSSETRILEILSSTDRGLNTTEIAKKLKSSRQTTGKYLEILTAKNLVKCRITGPVKLWFEKQENTANSSYEVLDDVRKEFDNWLRLSASFENGQIDKDQYLRKMEKLAENIRRRLDAH